MKKATIGIYTKDNVGSEIYVFHTTVSFDEMEYNTIAINKILPEKYVEYIADYLLKTKKKSVDGVRVTIMDDPKNPIECAETAKELKTRIDENI